MQPTVHDVLRRVLSEHGVRGDEFEQSLQELGLQVVFAAPEVRTRVTYALYDQLSAHVQFHEIEQATSAVMRQLAISGFEQ
jgi:hypothetical protein